MRYAQFYALAIFFMYRLCPRKVSSSWSVSLYMIFCFVSSGDGKAIWVRTKTYRSNMKMPAGNCMTVPAGINVNQVLPRQNLYVISLTRQSCLGL